MDCPGYRSSRDMPGWARSRIGTAHRNVLLPLVCCHNQSGENTLRCRLRNSAGGCVKKAAICRQLPVTSLQFRISSAPSHAILFAVIRCASILVLASVASFLATQPVPVRVQPSGESYAVLWQIEARGQRPAQTRIVTATVAPCGAAADDVPELVARAPRTIILPRHLRAPPLFFPDI